MTITEHKNLQDKYGTLNTYQSVTISNQALNLNLNEILQDIKNLEIYTKLPKNSGYNQLKGKVNNLMLKGDKIKE